MAQPLLFSLLGAAVDLDVIRGRDAGLGVALIVISGAFRFAATSNAVRGFSLKPKERLFVALAWLPKATVQAAVGAVALDAADSSGERERARDRGRPMAIVLTVFDRGRLLAKDDRPDGVAVHGLYIRSVPHTSSISGHKHRGSRTTACSAAHDGTPT